MTGLLDELLARIARADPEEIKLVRSEVMQRTADMAWIPNPGPQTEAYYCEADELLYGGEAGGGKTDLLLGLALTAHRRSLVLRRLDKEVDGLEQRLEEILGSRDGYNSQKRIWRRSDPKLGLIMLGGCQHLNDRAKYQGTPKDFIGFDELANFLEAQYTFIIAWARSTLKGQRVRVVAASNPPVRSEGMWINRRWAPWLMPDHPNPALPGELRWFTTIKGEDCEVDGPGPVEIDGHVLLDSKGKPVRPKSRSFIPAELADNPDLEESGYASILAALPSGMREAMMEGDFTIGQRDAPFQVIPQGWVEAAMDRWHEAGSSAAMTALGVDIAQGGSDMTVLAARHGGWFARLKTYKGVDTHDGPSVAGLIFMQLRDGAEVVLDMGGGYGGSTYDHLRQSLSPTQFNGAAAGPGRDKSGTLGFLNLRAAAWWALREALDPDYGGQIALPRDAELKSDLCAPTYKVVPGAKIQIEDKQELRKRIGRSPDRGDAVVMAHWASGTRRAGGHRLRDLPHKAVTSRRGR
ncbi:MAG: terminase [Pseudomonadota bacterium]